MPPHDGSVRLHPLPQSTYLQALIHKAMTNIHRFPGQDLAVLATILLLVTLAIAALILSSLSMSHHYRDQMRKAGGSDLILLKRGDWEIVTTKGQWLSEKGSGEKGGLYPLAHEPNTHIKTGSHKANQFAVTAIPWHGVNQLNTSWGWMA